MSTKDQKSSVANKSTQENSLSCTSSPEVDGKYKHGPETELSALVCQACENNNFDILADFLQVLADVDPELINEPDAAGMTALHFATSCQNIYAVKLLLQYGADVLRTDTLGFTPLFLSTGRYPDVDIARCLLQNDGSLVNIQTYTGVTPLHGAALQGNKECIKLLLEYGADPRVQDEDATTSFELAKDDRTRKMLHDAVTDIVNKRDNLDTICAQCRQIPKGKLYRCGVCYVTVYCSYECQKKQEMDGYHMAECPGHVLGSPHFIGEFNSHMEQVSFYKVMGSDKSNVKVFHHSGSAKEAVNKSKYLINSVFVVKVQLPLGLSKSNSRGEMMVYNVDRSVEGFINTSAKGYDVLLEKIISEGYKGIKAFFWAKLTESEDGTFQVFHGKCAPYQQW